MKFAKRLQEELEQAWDGQYLDYKLLKKVMKMGDTQVLQAFCDALDTELHKVHVFMRHQQEELQEEVPLMLPVPEEPPGTRPRGRSKGKGFFRGNDHTTEDNCHTLVRKIESFRHYSDLNIEAMRKIIKKFDKRFHCRFHEKVGLPSTADQLVTAQDISLRLLEPAQECLKQIRHFSWGASLTEHLERPLLKVRQFTFWVKVLENGVQLLGLHITGSGEDLAHSVKNTFIDISDMVESPLRRTRAHSWCGTRVQVVVPIEGPEFGTIDDDDGEAQSLPGSFESAQHSGSIFAGSNASASGSGRSQGSQLEKLSCGSRGGRSQAAPGAAAQAKKARGSNQRWWEELSDTCAVSGFPIAYLPYPPCKLQVGPGKNQKFVDGQYLLLHILSTLNFEVLGHSLTHAEIEAVDQHIKKCKLSPLRLSRALELLCQVGQHNDRARQELAELRTKATKKLGALRHIQRVRMQRGDCSGMPAQPGRVDPAQPGPSQAKGKGRSGKGSRPKGRTN